MGRFFGWAQRVARLTGYELVRHHFYSPVPFDTPRESWDRVSPLHGIDFDIQRQSDWLERVATHAREWVRPQSSMYGAVDAEVLYGTIRELQPQRVVELGAGASSGIIREALGRDHSIYDPVANDRTNLSVHRLSATDVPAEVFAELEDGDVLFVDTTHTVKTGGDVNHIILDLLPTLNAGVVVHIHDIFLPFEYPYAWAQEGRLWAEQYLLQAFLIGNNDWEVLCSCMAVSATYPERVAAVIPGFVAGSRPGAFWLRRRA
jgi:hypothetical protein